MATGSCDPVSRRSGTFKGGVTEGGGPHPCERYNVCPRRCRDTRTVTRVRHHLTKRRPKSVRLSRDSTVTARRVESVTVPSSRVSRECRSPGLRSPPLLKMPEKGPATTPANYELNMYLRKELKQSENCREILILPSRNLLRKMSREKCWLFRAASPEERG